MTSRMIARRRALATTTRESVMTGGGAPASETPGSRVRRTGFSIAKYLTLKRDSLFQITQCNSPNPDRLRDVVAIAVAVSLDHDRIIHAHLHRGRIRAGSRADGQVFQRVDTDRAVAVLGVAQDQLRAVGQRLAHRPINRHNAEVARGPLGDRRSGRRFV